MSEAAAAPAPLPDVRDPQPGHHHQGGLLKLTVGAIGIVFGDIGTSPLYAFRETFAGHHPLPVDRLHVFGVLSLIFWSMMIVVTLKYVTILMRADNKGEGGSLALLALISRKAEGEALGHRHRPARRVRLRALLRRCDDHSGRLGPVGGRGAASWCEAGLRPFVIPICIGILVGLFVIQQRGTAVVGALFGPVMIVYFLTLAGAGPAHHRKRARTSLFALSPHWAVRFFADNPFLAFVSMGIVVLAVTGAEALYADMGHFGRRPIETGWVYFVLPAMMINYLGQGVLMLSTPGGDLQSVLLAGARMVSAAARPHRHRGDGDRHRRR